MACEKEDKIRIALTKAIQTTMMDMSFIDVIESEMDESVEYSNLFFISFNEPSRGGIILRFSKECKIKIVENIHGSNWDSLSGSEIDDCLLEVLNVLAGNFLKNYYGNDQNYNMSFPQVLFDDQEIPLKNEYSSFYFDAEGVIFGVDICITEK